MIQNTIQIKHNKKEYLIDKDKLEYVFDLVKLDINMNDDKEIYSTLKEYMLLDEIFLENINKIW